MSSIPSSASTSALPPVLKQRRQSAVSRPRASRTPSLSCSPSAVEALDLSLPSPTATLASLRIFVLTHLAEVERYLCQLEYDSLADLEHYLAQHHDKVDEARAWAREGLALLEHIRADVKASLPALSVDPALVEHFMARLSELRVPDVRARLDDVKARLPDLESFELPHPEQYISTLSAHLQGLHSHLSSLELPDTRTALSAPTDLLADLLERLRDSELARDVRELQSSVAEKAAHAEDTLRDVAAAMKLAAGGSRLIKYVDLPDEWKNNPHVTHGYRFIPLNRWHLIALSVFMFHNETLNIHTHLIPFCLWSRQALPSPSSILSFPRSSDPPVAIFTFFALLCLGTSTLWHTMAGCAHRNGMVLTAKLDYVGIGWLISASVGSVAYYAFREQVGAEQYTTHADFWVRFYLSVCGATGLAGSILPFKDWFNTPEHKSTRVLFFVGLALSAVAPLAHITLRYGLWTMLAFISPVLHSVLSYLAGLFFYVSCLPECIIPESWGPVLHFAGGGSHAIWHAFIVLAIHLHRQAMPVLARGVQAAIA
ncbi:HlyIII-domain-containing protein [Peniophora sp. CONT]|nr:HlyIII-domain-containing protein [Peniophora sp. CONT]